MSRTTRALAAALIVAGGLLAAALPVAAADQAAVTGRDIAGHGTLLVAASNQMTVYTFTKDVANSGKSNCTGGCLTKWPALTIDSGSTPTADNGLSSHLGTITRSDNSATQVTWDGKPLYFFAGDSKPGDANGIYPNWEAVVLSAVEGATSAPSAGATAPSTSTSTPSQPDSSLPWLAIAALAALSLIGSTAILAYRRVRVSNRER